jgi:trk system potassium uptake protein TrkA
MRMIIVGCGRMGSGLARALSLQGHTVTVVDADPTRFDQLGSSFKGRTVVGVGFDRDVLLEAGIERADGLAAVTPSDEANVVAARLAGQVFHVPKVVARVYDPRKAEIYRRLGLQTIDPVTWGIHSIADLLISAEVETVLSLGSDAQIVKVDVPSLLVGRTVRELSVPGEICVISISRGSESFLPTQGAVFQSNDLLHVAVRSSSMERLHQLLALR